MNRKVRNLFRYLILILPFIGIFVAIYNTGNIETSFQLICSYYVELIEQSVFADLFTSFSMLIFPNELTVIVFGTFVLYAFYEIIDIMFDVLMFLPRFLDKCMDNLGKERD